MEYHSESGSESEMKQNILVNPDEEFTYLHIWFPLPFNFPNPYLILQEVVSNFDAFLKPYVWNNNIMENPDDALCYMYNNPFQHQESISIHPRIPQTWTQTSLLLDLHWYLLIHQTPTSYNVNWKKSPDAKCPCTRLVRTPQKIWQIFFIWWYFTLSFAMSIIVEIVYSSPTKNTCSQKRTH